MKCSSHFNTEGDEVQIAIDMTYYIGSRHRVLVQAINHTATAYSVNSPDVKAELFEFKQELFKSPHCFGIKKSYSMICNEKSKIK